jgi:hypothetical protein
MENHKYLFKMAVLFMFSVGFNSAGHCYEAQEGKVTAAFGTFLYKTDFAATKSGAVSSELANGALLIGGDISRTGSLEISIFPMHKLYYKEKDQLVLVEKVQQMHISMGYRYWIGTYLSTALAFYSSYPMDSAVIVHSDFAVGADEVTSARDKTEYGLDLSIQTEVWSNDRISFIVDGRYSLSTTSIENEKANHYGILLALKFLVQERYPDR